MSNKTTTINIFFSHQKEFIQKMGVAELGAGVGLTGIVISKCIKPRSLLLTDYLDAALENIKHNLTQSVCYFLFLPSLD